MDLQTINERYGKYVWAIANRYHTGIWAPEDVFNQLLLMIYSAIKDGQLGSDKSDRTVKRVHSFIISRAINIVRGENKRKFVRVEQEDLKQSELKAPMSPEAKELEKRLIMELLLEKLDRKTAAFIFELTFPSQTTLNIAKADQEDAKADEYLRMNIRNEVRVLPRHVVKSLAGYGQSSATTSRMRNEARAAFGNYFGEMVSENKDIIDEILGL